MSIRVATGLDTKHEKTLTRATSIDSAVCWAEGYTAFSNRTVYVVEEREGFDTNIYVVSDGRMRLDLNPAMNVEAPIADETVRERAHVEGRRRYGTGQAAVLRRVGFEAGAEWQAEYGSTPASKEQEIEWEQHFPLEGIVGKLATKEQDGSTKLRHIEIVGKLDLVWYADPTIEVPVPGLEGHAWFWVPGETHFRIEIPKTAYVSMREPD